MQTPVILIPLLSVLFALPIAAGEPSHAHRESRSGHDNDSRHGAQTKPGAKSKSHENQSFEAIQSRGEAAMGVDQYTSTHLFDALPDGGRIELQRDQNDPAGVEQIRSHLLQIASAFKAGDFSTPAFVHMREMPGVDVMASKRTVIDYAFTELPRGGEVRISTLDPKAVAAVHAFMAAQRHDHKSHGRTK